MSDYVSPGDPGDEQDMNDTVRRMCVDMTEMLSRLFIAIELAKRANEAVKTMVLPDPTFCFHPLDLELAREVGLNLSGVNVLETEAIPVSDSARLPLRGRRFRSGRT